MYHSIIRVREQGYSWCALRAHHEPCDGILPSTPLKAISVGVAHAPFQAHNNKNRVTVMSEVVTRKKKASAINTTRIHIKLKKDLKAELEQKAADNYMSLSQLLLQSSRNSQITVKRVEAPKLSKEFMALTAATNKFGAQLNMIGKHCNYYKGGSDTLKIFQALIDVERGLAELRDVILGEPVEVTHGTSWV